MRSNPRLLAFTFAALAGLAGCSSSTTPAGSNVDPPAGQEAMVEVHPSRVWVAPGGTFDFTSIVTGTSDTSVTWGVVEPGGGTVSSTGTYTAPLTSGTYTITATTKGKALGRSKVKVTPTPTPTVAISPSSASVTTTGSVAFSATVTGATDPSVAWSVRETSGCGSIDATGVYTAPASGATCHVDAASVESPTATDEVAVVVSPPPSSTPTAVVVAITPSSGAVDACRSLTFSASVSGATSGTVTWSVQEGSAGGTITPSGVYTAPAAAGTYHVMATSQAVPTSSTAVAVTVSDRILGVAVSPTTISLAPGATAQFTSTVTTSCGSFSSTQTVTAPN